jgi:hypothetical protein
LWLVSDGEVVAGQGEGEDGAVGLAGWSFVGLAPGCMVETVAEAIEVLLESTWSGDLVRGEAWASRWWTPWNDGIEAAAAGVPATDR